MKKITVLAIGLLAIALGSRAQQQQRQVPSPENNAKRITNLMKKELGIDDKQYNKLYKINLQQQKEMFSNRKAGGPQGEAGGQRPPRPQGERPEGMPPGGGMGGHGGMRPEMGNSSSSLTKEQMEKNQAKREKKIQKILGDEGYKRWKEVEKAERERMMKERPSHKAQNDKAAPSDGAEKK